MSSDSLRNPGASGEGFQPYQHQPYQPQGPHVQEQPALDAANEDDYGDDELSLGEVDTQSSEYMSMWSSILEHEYENGRRVCECPGKGGREELTDKHKILTLAITVSSLPPRPVSPPK